MVCDEFRAFSSRFSFQRERKEFEEREREREECPNLFSPLVERARRPMSLGGAEGSPTLN